MDWRILIASPGIKTGSGILSARGPLKGTIAKSKDATYQSSFRNAILWSAGFSINSCTRKDIVRIHYFWASVAVNRMNGGNKSRRTSIVSNVSALYASNKQSSKNSEFS
jgi:hypothetical protein